MEFDLRRYWGVPLRALFTGELTHRELVAFVQNLPRDSATARAVLGEAADWSPELNRLTDIAELLAAGNWQRGGGKMSRPKPIRRPSIPDE